MKILALKNTCFKMEESFDKHSLPKDFNNGAIGLRNESADRDSKAGMG